MTRVIKEAVLGTLDSSWDYSSRGPVISGALGYLGDRRVLRAIGNPRELRKALGQAIPGEPVFQKGDLLADLQELGSGNYYLLSAPGLTEYSTPPLRPRTRRR